MLKSRTIPPMAAEETMSIERAERVDHHRSNGGCYDGGRRHGGCHGRSTALSPGLVKSSFEERSGAQETRLYRLFPQMTADAVAAAGYRGMMRGRNVVIPGRGNLETL